MADIPPYPDGPRDGVGPGLLADRGRIGPIDPEQLRPEQQDVFDRVAGTRGRVAGPFTVLLHAPTLADRVQHLGAYLRYEATLDRDIAETAVLATARVAGSPFEWDAHEPSAAKAGVPAEVISLLRSGADASAMPERYRVVSEYCRQLASSGQVSDDTYHAAVALLGREGGVELTVLVGYYLMLALTLSAHQVESPEARTAFRV